MKKYKISLFMLSMLLVSCGTNSNESTTSSSNNNESQISSSDSTNNKDSSSPIVKKELTIDNIYNDFLSLANNGNFTIKYDDKTEDIYTKDYVILNSSSIAYFKGETIYSSSQTGIYKAKYNKDKDNNDYTFTLMNLMEGEDEDGYPSNLPLSDFHTINKFSYLTNENYGAQKSDLILSSDQSEITLDYDSNSENRMFTIIALMFGNKNNVVLGNVNHISLKYDDENNIVATFSYKNSNGTYTNPTSFQKGMITAINKTSNQDAIAFLNTISSKIGSKTFDYYSTYSIRNSYLSTDTNIKAIFESSSKTQDLGTYKLDYNPNNILITSYDGSLTYIRRGEDGGAYYQGINALNEVYDESLYAQTFSNLDFGYKDFDFEGFRYSDDEKAYIYYGLNAGDSLNSISYTGLSNMEFESVKLYVDDESNQINKIVAHTTSSLTQTSQNTYENVSYDITIDIKDYRSIGKPSVYSIDSSTTKVQTIFNKINDYENTTFKTVAEEWYEGIDTRMLQPIVTTYYTSDVVYKETSQAVKNGNAYTTTTTGNGIYAIKNEEGKTIGVKLFKVDKDGKVSPRSEIIYGKTLKDYWINIKASPLVYELNGKILTPKDGMSGNKLKNYMPISHSRFEAQEGSMSNGGDYTSMTFTMKMDGTTITNEIDTFQYYYGTESIFGSSMSGTGLTTFTYGSESSPITIDSSIYSQLESMGTFAIPTKWSESQSKDIYTALQAYYSGKKNRYGQKVDVDRDIPYLFDDDLDETWVYSQGNLKNTPTFNIYHKVNDIINDGDINNYNAKYEVLLQNNQDYTYTSGDTGSIYQTLYYYVNGDIVIGMSSSAAGGIYFYTAIPDYSD